MRKHLLIGCTVVLFSCGSPDSENREEPNDKVEKQDSTELPEEEPYLDPLSGLRYTDDGKKWEVNPETQVGMEKVDSIVSAFDGDDYVLLGTEIKEVLSEIISACTMKGEDHDQYHIVLLATMKESKAMKRGEVETTEKVEEFLEAYYSHFQVWAVED